MGSRTLENCSVIKEAVNIGIGTPKQANGKCEGYENINDDEPYKVCKDCKFLSLE